MKKLLFFTLMNIFLLGCDAKPINYDNRIHHSSSVRAGSSQTGRLNKPHQRRGVSLSGRAFKNRLNTRSYYYRNKKRMKLRKGD